MREDMIAVFADPDAAMHALSALHDEGVTTARIASPAPYPAVEHTGQPGPWRLLGWLAFAAGVAGLASAIALEVYASRSFSHIVGGKPVVSWTAFGVIMFELTMLFAGVTTFFALVVLAAVARRKVAREARAAVSSERIVVVVPLDGHTASRDAISRSLSGAAEVLS